MGRCSFVVSLLALCLAAGPGCTFISKSTEFNGVPSFDGRPVEYVSATTVGVNLLFILPLVGDASVTNTIQDLTERVKEDGAEGVRIVQSGTSYFWYVFLPFSIIIHPVTTSVTAEAAYPGPAEIEIPAGAAAGSEGDV